MKTNKMTLRKTVWLYLTALIPLVLAGLMWYVSTMLSLISRPSDRDVFIGLAMVTGLILFAIYIMLKIKRHENN